MRANNVSSPPIPTFLPGWNRVPRCRTMIVPAWIFVPPNTFTPRRWALESRPLRVEPPPLVFDMASALRDGGDLDDRVLLAVPVAAALVGAPLVREPVDLRALGGADDAPLDGGALQLVGGGEDGVTVDEEDGAELDRVRVVVRGEQLQVDLLPFGNAGLLPT